MKEIIVAVVIKNDTILILKRSSVKRFDPNKWEFISSFIKDKSDLELFAQKKIKEETGLVAYLQKKGEPFEVNDQYGKWLIHPFLFTANTEVVILQSDHTDYKWTSIIDLDTFDCVKDLDKNLVQLKLM